RAALPEGEIAAGLRAGVEMLMIDRIGRHDERADLPVIADRIAAGSIRPHQRIALAAQDDHMSTWTMGVSFFVGADRKLRDMAGQRCLREIEANMSAARATLLRDRQRQI